MSMSPLEEAMAVLIGREPSTEDVQKFYKVKEICGLSDHDPIWSMLLAFGHYETLYRAIPEQIIEQSRATIAEHKLALEATHAAAENLVKHSLAEAVSRSAGQIADTVLGHASKRVRAAIFASIGFAAVAVALVAGAAFMAGQRMSAAEVAWLHTPEGEAAREFSRLNNVRAMLECPSGFPQRDKGKGTYCVPYDPQGKKTFGWRVR
jgi:hypothetical protein